MGRCSFVAKCSAESDGNPASSLIETEQSDPPPLYDRGTGVSVCRARPGEVQNVRKSRSFCDFWLYALGCFACWHGDNVRRLIKGGAFPFALPRLELDDIVHHRLPWVGEFLRRHNALRGTQASVSAKHCEQSINPTNPRSASKMRKSPGLAGETRKFRANVPYQPYLLLRAALRNCSIHRHQSNGRT